MSGFIVSLAPLLMPEEAQRFQQRGSHFASHKTIDHPRDEFISAGDPMITTNTVVSYFSVLKRGMKRTYQHCAQ